jgi:hypothetical protein
LLQAVIAIATTSATGNGNITTTGGENCSERGMLYWGYDDTDKVRGDVDGITAVFEENDNTGNFWYRSIYEKSNRFIVQKHNTMQGLTQQIHQEQATATTVEFLDTLN